MNARMAMRRRICTAVFGLAAVSILGTSALAQAPAVPPNPQIEIAYVEPATPDYRPIYERLKQRQVLEELRQFLSPLLLTRKVQVKVDQCGGMTSRYQPGGPVVICYEYVARI